MAEERNARGELERLGQVMIPVTDLGRATAFYRDVLEVPFLFDVPRMAFFELGGLRLMLGEREDGAAATGSILYFQVEDIDTASDRLRRRGVAFDQDPTLIAEMEDHDLWMAFFRDSEGNQMALMSEVADD
ncbi:MAG: VOC family protein [Longimicrobiales bacterium]|nr:VOC family protein [Longimicrobiales bacterium]